MERRGFITKALAAMGGLFTIAQAKDLSRGWPPIPNPLPPPPPHPLPPDSYGWVKAGAEHYNKSPKFVSDKGPMLDRLFPYDETGRTYGQVIAHAQKRVAIALLVEGQYLEDHGMWTGPLTKDGHREE